MPKEQEERKLSPVGKRLLHGAINAVDVDKLLDGPIVCFFGPNSKDRYEELERIRNEDTQGRVHLECKEGICIHPGALEDCQSCQEML